MMIEKKEESRKVVASEKYSVEAIKNITLNKRKDAKYDVEDKYKVVIDESRVKTNYFNW